MKDSPRLARRFYERETLQVAKALLGQRLVRVLEDGTRLAGLIVETEAYLGIEDKAAHTYGGRRTKRVQTMWGQAGHAYVYFTSGMHHCVNVVPRRQGVPEAVLIRAIEPTQGLDAMRQLRTARRRQASKPKKMADTDLCSGPAKLCQALAIDRNLDGQDLTYSQQIWIERARGRALPSRIIGVSPRIGVDYAEEWADEPLRFYVRNHTHLSRQPR